MVLPRLALVGDPRSISPWLLSAMTRVGRLEAICGPGAEECPLSVPVRWAFSDASRMLREAEPEGVVIQCPMRERAALIKQCLAAAARVLLTGIPAAAAMCRRLDSMGKVTGRAILAASAIRFSPAVRQAERLLESGRFGLPVSLAVRSSWPSSHRGPAPASPSPVDPDQVFEAVDLVFALLGGLRQVHASIHATGVLSALCNAENGANVLLECHSSGDPELDGVEIDLRAADGTWLRIDRAGHLTCARGSKVEAWHHPSAATADPAKELGYEGLLAEFRRTLVDHRGVSGGLLRPAPAVTATVEAIFASGQKNRPTRPTRSEGSQAEDVAAATP